jgi:hypothetical protein
MSTPAAIHSPLLDVSDGTSYFKSVVLIEEQVDVGMADSGLALSLHGVERTTILGHPGVKLFNSFGDPHVKSDIYATS